MDVDWGGAATLDRGARFRSHSLSSRARDCLLGGPVLGHFLVPTFPGPAFCSGATPREMALPSTEKTEKQRSKMQRRLEMTRSLMVGWLESHVLGRQLCRKGPPGATSDVYRVIQEGVSRWAGHQQPWNSQKG